jgi:hypothetical protein
MISEYLTGIDVAGSGTGLTEVASDNLPGETNESYEKSQSV